MLLTVLNGRLRHSGHPAIEALSSLKALLNADCKIAILATQPEDWITYEGAYKPIARDNLLLAWAHALPPGWVGVPTYHPSEALNPAIEEALASACPRLKFLPHPLSQGTTELLIDLADGLVTLSSTSAATALLFGKQVVVQGLSPFQAWTVSDPAAIENAASLTELEAANLFCFLTHRYTELNSVLEANPLVLKPLMDRLQSRDRIGDWYLDIDDWSFDRAKAMFPN
jgi:hypothetical protein